MAKTYYERLTAMDTSFLVLEGPGSPLHVSATLIYEAGPLKTKDGGIDVAAYRAATESVLHRIPRYRQKLQWIPAVAHPVWILRWQAHVALIYTAERPSGLGVNPAH